MSPFASTRRLALLAAALAVSITAAPAFAGPQEDARAQNAVRVLVDMQAIPESAIPDKLLDEARAIVVVPDTIKAGLIFGGRRGHGLMSVKTPEGTWSNPSFVKLTGGSIGLQAGVQSADVVLAFRSDRGLESIVNGKFTLGADAAVAAGPLGRNAATATDGELKAEIWSWSRARGLFAGVALDGAVLSMDDKANEAVYGRDTTPRMILEGRIGTPPSNAVVDFRDRLEEATAIARSNRGTSAPVAMRQPVPQPVAPAPADDTMAVPQPFEPVGEGPVTSEPLPETP
jgi:lipid-binding SYLF domain-containing protein